MLHELLLPPNVHAPGMARHNLQSALHSLPSSVLDDLLLLTTEVVTNSIRHAGVRHEEVILLEVRVSHDVVRVQVTDHGSGERFGPRRPADNDTGGRGLLLVAEVSDRWGIERSQATSVWFELDLTDARARAL